MVAYLNQHSDLVKDKSVVELGAGTGLAGLVSAVLGARSVCVTDIPPVLELLERNLSTVAAQVPRVQLMMNQQLLICREYNW